MDKLQAMRSFVAIVDRGSLTAAAATLGRSLPTMVRTLSALEENLGARLLQRTTRRMSLTPEGQDYLERCRRILGEIEEAEAAVTRAGVTPRGRVRITAPVLFGQLHVAPTVSGFLRAYPEVEVELLLLDRVVNLVEEGIDLAVRIAHLADSAMVALPVGLMRRVVCASPGLLAADGVPTHPEELATRPCVQFRGINPSGSWRFQEDGREFTVQTRGALTCNQATATAAACVEGLGFGRFLAYQVEARVRAGELVIVLEDFELPALPVSLVYPEAHLSSSRVRALVDWVRDDLRKRPDIHPKK